LGNEDIRFEKTDVNVGAVVRFGIGLLVLVLLAPVLMWWMFRSLASREGERQLPPPVMKAGTAPIPPPPRLQRQPALELQQLRAREGVVLNSYEWKDPEKQIVQIPIEQAIRRLAARGLPARPLAKEQTPHEAGPHGEDK